MFWPAFYGKHFHTFDLRNIHTNMLNIFKSGLTKLGWK